MKEIIATLTAVFSLALFIPNTALAYIDPGAGSALLALIAGGVSGLLIILKAWRDKILRRGESETDRDSADASEDSDPSQTDQ